MDGEKTPTWIPITPIPDDCPASPPTSHPRRGEPINRYLYYTPHGEAVGWVYEFLDSKQEPVQASCVWAEDPATGARMWRWLAFPEPRPLYRCLDLPRLHLSAADPIAPWVLVLPTETAADAASVFLDGVLADGQPVACVSWAGGPHCVLKSDWTPIEACRVVIWPEYSCKRKALTKYEVTEGVDPASKPFLADKHQPGTRAAGKIAELLKAQGCEVSIFTLPEPGAEFPLWGIQDLIASGLAGAALWEFIVGRLDRFAPSKSGTNKVVPQFVESGLPVWEDDRPRVQLGGDRLVTAMQQAERHLMRETGTPWAPPFFQRCGILMRLATVDQLPDDDGRIRRPMNSVVLTPVTEEWLRRRFMQDVCFVKRNQKTDETMPTNLPLEYAKSYLNGGEWWAPVLKSVVHTPLLRQDGTVLHQPGFDAKSGIYLASDIQVKLPPERKPGEAIDPLTDKALMWAKDVFVDLFEPFSPASRLDFAVLVSAVLSGLLPSEVSRSPGIVITAPVFGTGKGKLVDMIGVILTGETVPKMTLTDDDKEMKKLLFAALLAGDKIICIDEIRQRLYCPALDSMITETRVNDRVLGLSKQATVNTTDTVFFALGNNVTVQADQTRRFLRCYLDPRCEEPHKRKFDRDPVEHVRANRAKIITAGLTLLHGFFAAGCPQAPNSSLGSFEGWSRTVRNCLIWAGVGDPCGTMELWKTADTGKLLAGGLLAAWWKAFKDEPTTISEVCAAVEDSRGMDAVKFGDLMSVMNEVCYEKKAFNRRKFAGFIAKEENRVIDGYRFEKAGVSHHAVKWKVVQA